ncbi:MAG: DEAD/DEAH box helicase [Methanobrevibacter sp.]|nr:DEAD/DEAH box helicase [Methanobrevibacter sp.]
MDRYIKHPLIKSNTAEARLYQQILAADALKTGNTMIVAPTALGKTLIGVLVAAERLKKIKGSKVLVLAPSKPLAIQHEENFRHFLTVKCTSITGAVKVDDRKKRWDESQVICATPQTVESDLLNGRYSLEDVSLIVFDECHHAVGSYAYVYLGQRYLKTAKNHLILALTASPGSDQGKIREICENLFIQDVVVKTEDDPDVKPYFNPVEIDWVKVKMSKELEKIKEHITKSLKTRLKILKNINVIKTISVSKIDILKARGIVQNRIARAITPPKECYNAISILSAVINLQHALELLETQGIATFNKYINRLRKKTTKAAKSLLNDADFSIAISLAKNAEKHGWEHPKLRKLIQILKEELNLDTKEKPLVKKIKKENSSIEKNNNKKTKIIVFTQFRDTLETIYQKCEEEGIKSAKFFGQGSRDGEKGLTQTEQKNIIKSFKVGNFDVLLSTSVAEEGIDIPAVDLVILYEPVPSEVRMIQRRGRTGRKDTGKMKVLIAEGTRDEGYYWASINKERKMKEHLIDKDSLKNLNVKSTDKLKEKPNSKIIGRKLEIGIERNDGIEENTENVEDLKKVNTENLEKLKEKNSEDIEKVKEKDPKNIEEIKEEKIKKVVDEALLFDSVKASKGQKVLVYADSREGNSKVLRALDTINVDIKIKTMVAGDYQVSDEVAIERKTAKDFVDSIVDKRLYKQGRILQEEFKKPILILEGDDIYSGFLSPDAIRGAIASIAIDFGISIIPTRNPEDTAAMIKRIAIREQSGKSSPIQIRTERKPANVWEQQLFIIESLPNIGPVTAKKLLEKFGTVNKVINAKSNELQEISGVGPKTAENIRKVLDSKYLYFKKDNKDKKLI